MADKINKENLNEEGLTRFGGIFPRLGNSDTPTGPIGRLFAKFFTTKAAPYLDDTGQVDPTDTSSVVTGDTIKTDQIVRETSPVAGGVQRNLLLPQTEANRRRRYQQYEEMDDYPEIGAAFDIYADDCTQRDSRNRRWRIVSDESMVVDEVENLFKKLRLENQYWDIARNTVKYGDCFTELILDVNKPKEGIKRIKILNPNWIIRVEDEYGYLKKFIQEIPDPATLMQGTMYGDQKPKKRIDLDKNQIVHFRLMTSDPVFYPYGRSIAALTHHTFRSLKFMEDAMMIYRLSRAPERRIFYVDVGNLPTGKAEMFIEKLKATFKKEKFYNQQRGTVDSRFNPLSMDEDFFVPTKNGKGTKIDTLPGATNLGEIEDVRYYRDKLLAALKIPKDYIVEKDKSPERKANLSQLDVKFGRTIQRVQQNIATGLENIAKRHLQLRGYPETLIRDLRIELPDPSDMIAKRKLDLDQQKAQVVQSVIGLGLFSKDEVLRQYYEMNEEEIARMKEDVEKEQQEQMQQQAADSQMQAQAQAQGETEGAIAGGGAPPGAPAQAAESKNLDNLGKLLEYTTDDNKKKVLERIINKQSSKIKIDN